MPEIDRDFIVPLLVTVGALLWIANQVRQLFGKGRNSPQPFIVELNKHYTPIEEHRELQREVRGGFTKLELELKEVDRERRESVSRSYKAAEAASEKLRLEIKSDISQLSDNIRDELQGTHSRMSDVVEAVAELRGEIKNLRKP